MDAPPVDVCCTTSDGLLNMWNIVESPVRWSKLTGSHEIETFADLLGFFSLDPHVSINMSPYCKYGNLSQHDGSDSADLGTALGYVGYRIREDRCNSGTPKSAKK